MNKGSKDKPKTKRISVSNNPSGADELLKISDRVRIQARRADNIANWRTRTIQLLGPFQHNDPPSMTPDKNKALLLTAQTQRDAGVRDADSALCIIFCMAEQLAEDQISNDPTLQSLSAKMDAIEKREGLTEDEYWPRNDPEIPQDYKDSQIAWDRCANDIIAAVLRQFDEGDIADLFLHNREEFDHRFEAGRRIAFDDPDGKKLQAIKEGRCADVE